MKRLILILLVVALLSVMVVVPAFAAEEEHCASGRIFGKHHAEMAQAGMLDGEMNPGMHRGYSHCLP